MAKGGSKRSNQIAQQSQAGMAGIGATNVGRGQEAYGYGTGIRDYATEQYKALLEGGGDGGGGGGGGGGGSAYQGDLDAIRTTGGFNPEQVNALRGYGLPKEWAQTGGWTDPEKTNFRLRTTASVPGFFDAMRRNLGQRAAVSGGYGPGIDAASLALAREQARGGAAAALESEGSLQDSIRKGKMWGSETGASNERSIFGNQQWALGESIANERSARAAANARAASDFNQKMAVLGELRQLRGETGAETDYDRIALQGYGGGLGGREQQQPGTSTGDRIMQGAAVAAPVIIALGGKPKNNPKVGGVYSSSGSYIGE